MVEEKKSGAFGILDDVFPFVLAFLTLVIFLIVVFWLVRPGDTDNVGKVITGFIAWIGAIIGFYFGNKPVKGLREQVEQVSVDKGIYLADRDTMKANLNKVNIAYSKLSQNKVLYDNVRSKAMRVQEKEDITSEFALSELLKSLKDFDEVMRNTDK